MSRITSLQLRQKDVINLCDGTRLGCVSEIELDTCSGQICSLILSSGSGMLNLFKDSRIVLPWSRIECIGEDAILVKISTSEFDNFFKHDKKRKCFETD